MLLLGLSSQGLNNVSTEESKGHPEVKHIAPWVPPCKQDRASAFGASLVRGLEEKVSRRGNVGGMVDTRSANLAESTFKSSSAFTDCSKKLLNFLCDLSVFLSV